MIEIPNRISLDKTATALYCAKVPDAAQILPRSSAPNPTSGAVWCAEVLPQREPSLRSNSLAANLLVPLLHIHEIRILIDLLLRVPELFLELELVVLNVLLELGDLLVVALLPLRLLLEILLRHVALERRLLLLEGVQLRHPVDDLRVLVDLASRHALSLELRLLRHDVLLQLLHVLELLLAEALRWLFLLLLRREGQGLRGRRNIHLAGIASSEQVIILALLRRGVLGSLVARGDRLLPRKNTLRIHEVRIPLKISNLPGLRVARLLVLLARQGINLPLQELHLRHRLSDDSLRRRVIHLHEGVVSTGNGARA